MAPKMALRRLWPELQRSCRLGNNRGYVISERITRSTHDSVNTDYASLIFANGVGPSTELPGLIRQDLVNCASEPLCNSNNTKSRKTQLSTFTDDKNSPHPVDIEKGFALLNQGCDDNSFLSELHYSYDAAYAALTTSPSTRHASARQIRHWFRAHGSGHLKLRSWALNGVLSRQRPSSDAKITSSLALRIAALMDGGLSRIGPCNKYSGVGTTFDFVFELRFQPKTLAFHASLDKSAKEPTQNVTDLVTDILGKLQESLRGREFTSVVSMNEAMIMYLKEHFCHSKLEQYLELEGINLVCNQVLKGGRSVRWVHEAPRFQVSPYYGDLGTRVLPSLCKYRQGRNRDATKKEATPFDRANANERSYDSFKISVHPYALDISAPSDAQTNFTSSAIASRFEQDCAKIVAKGLPSILDSFLTVSQNLPTKNKDDTTVRISQNASALPAQPSTSPTYFMELKKGTANKSVNVSVYTSLQRSFQLRFNSTDWKNRPIHVKQILFQMSSLDAATVKSLLDQPASEQVGLKREIDHLAENATSIVQKVCDGVKFNDVTTVTGYLAEAILRVVRPLTVGFLLERVSMDVVIGDDSVTLRHTVSVPDLGARSHTSSGYISPSDYVEIPSGYQATVSESEASKKLSSSIAEKTGFSDRIVQLISYPAAEYRSSDYCKVIDLFDRSLAASRDCDFHALQTIVCKSLKEAAEGESTVITLRAPAMPVSVPVFGNTFVRGQVSFFSDGDVVCALNPISRDTLELKDIHEGGPGPVVVQIWLRGAPTRQSSGRINARQQMATINKTLDSKLSAECDGFTFCDLKDYAKKIADMVFEAKSEFEEHFVINTVSVEVNYQTQSATGSATAQKDNTTVDDNDSAASNAEWKLPFFVKDSDRSVVESIDTTHPSEVVDDEDEPRADTHVYRLSARDDVSKDASAIKALLQELDSRLQALMPNSFTTSIASDGTTNSIQPDSAAKSGGQMQRGVVVALGSNVGNRIEEIEKACRAIDADPDMRIVDTSFLYETKPMYVEDQGSFVNGACEIETSLSPIQLLDRLQAIERGHGRVKLVDKGPRNIDLDIVIFRDEVVETERLTVPHMLMHEREFVLRPIMDLASMHKWKSPRTKDQLHLMFAKLVNPRCDAQDSAQTTQPMYTMTPLTTRTVVNTLDPCRPTLVMSIMNTTPDSFSDGELNTLDPQRLRETAAAHIAAGATIIDVGGQSSRPNAPDVTAEEEIGRVLPAIAAIRSLPEAEGVAISVDTYRAAVAEAAVNAGAHIVNDISAGALDPQMLSTVARLECTYVVMHMRGTPATMQTPENCTYEGKLCTEIVKELASRVALAVEAGIRRWRIILDPGIGFAKTQDQNLELLRNALYVRNRVSTQPGRVRGLRYMPQLIGSSRKGFIGSITGVKEPRDRIFGTAAAVTASIRLGADIVRVHDVQEMVQVAKMADAIYRYENNKA